MQALIICSHINLDFISIFFLAHFSNPKEEHMTRSIDTGHSQQLKRELTGQKPFSPLSLEKISLSSQACTTHSLDRQAELNIPPPSPPQSICLLNFVSLTFLNRWAKGSLYVGTYLLLFALHWITKASLVNVIESPKIVGKTFASVFFSGFLPLQQRLPCKKEIRLDMKFDWP